MAKTVKIAGATYSDVPGVDLPLADNTGNARFTDTSDATATADKILSGYTAYGANGTKLTGTASGGGGGTDHDFIVTGDLDPDTMTLSNISHTLAEIVAASQADKDVRFNAIVDYEGVATIIYSLPLVNSQSINFGGSFFYLVEFSVSSNSGADGTTYVSVSGTNAEGPEKFDVRVLQEPNPTFLSVYLNATGDAISSTSGHRDLDNAIEIINSDYPERLHVSLVFNGIGGDELLMQKTQVIQIGGIQRFEGIRNGIKYTLNVQLYADSQDIPQGTYYEVAYVDDNQFYAAFTIERELDGVSYILINATTTTQSNAITTTISSVTWPEDLESKLSILMAKPQMANINVLIRETNEFNTFFSLPVQIALPPTLEATLIAPNGGSIGHAYLAYCKIEIVATEPESGYYEQLSNGAYITVNCEITTT